MDKKTTVLTYIGNREGQIIDRVEVQGYVDLTNVGDYITFYDGDSGILKPEYTRIFGHDNTSTVIKEKLETVKSWKDEYRKQKLMRFIHS